jgi:hypothetical protein
MTLKPRAVPLPAKAFPEQFAFTRWHGKVRPLALLGHAMIKPGG